MLAKSSGKELRKVRFCELFAKQSPCRYKSQDRQEDCFVPRRNVEVMPKVMPLSHLPSPIFPLPFSSVP